MIMKNEGLLWFIKRDIEKNEFFCLIIYLVFCCFHLSKKSALNNGEFLVLFLIYLDDLQLSVVWNGCWLFLPSHWHETYILTVVNNILWFLSNYETPNSTIISITFINDYFSLAKNAILKHTFRSNYFQIQTNL